jgi:hypothetical protein
MKLRYNLTLLFALAFSLCFGQPKTIKVQSGNWQFTQYAANIIKVSFKPTAYTTAKMLAMRYC